MLLKDKVAVIYGAGGSVGAAVAKTFAKEGAQVFLAGRTRQPLEAVAAEIKAAGGQAEAGVVDALDKQAVEDYVAGVVRSAGALHISFNLIGLGDAQGIALMDMTPEHFNLPITAAMTTHFITGGAAARHMAAHRNGVILALTAHAGVQPYAKAGGFGVACAAIEAACRQMTAEYGPLGVRVVCLRSSGSPDAHGVYLAWKAVAESAGQTFEEFEASMAEKKLLRRMPYLKDVANAAAMFASDYAYAITGEIANLTCGEVID
jgi:NAD(P)-dependent dehydrogenase (short-subunit alcohol dehydrogenase family)